MNRHEKKAKEYEEKNFPKPPNEENLQKLTTLCKKLSATHDEYNRIQAEINNLKLPNIIMNFAMSNPDLEIVSTTDKLCSVLCASNNIKQMPRGATDIHVKDNKISFKVLLD